MSGPDLDVVPVRLGGTMRLEDGSDLMWTIADGRLGRRWREVTSRLGRIVSAHLVEISPERALARLEMAAPGGLLTLHPSTDGRTLHGNVVTPSGVRHLALGWGSSHRLLVAGSVASVAVACRRLETQVPPGGGTVFRGVAVDPDLRVEEASVRVERVALTGWRLTAPALGVSVFAEVDERGLPLGGTSWPLEQPSPD